MPVRFVLTSRLKRSAMSDVIALATTLQHDNPHRETYSNLFCESDPSQPRPEPGRKTGPTTSTSYVRQRVLLVGWTVTNPLCQSGEEHFLPLAQCP